MYNPYHMAGLGQVAPKAPKTPAPTVPMREREGAGAAIGGFFEGLFGGIGRGLQPLAGAVTATGIDPRALIPGSSPYGSQIIGYGPRQPGTGTILVVAVLGLGLIAVLAMGRRNPGAGQVGLPVLLALGAGGWWLLQRGKKPLLAAAPAAPPPPAPAALREAGYTLGVSGLNGSHHARVGAIE